MKHYIRPIFRTSLFVFLVAFFAGQTGFLYDSVAHAQDGTMPLTTTPTPTELVPTLTPQGDEADYSTPEAPGKMSPQLSNPSQPDGLNFSQAASAADVRGYWQFQNDPLLQNGLEDSSTYGNTGSNNPLNSTVFYKPGIGLKPVNGVSVPGLLGLKRDGIQLPIKVRESGSTNNSLLVSGNQITLEGWVKGAEYGAGNRHIIDNYLGYTLSILNGQPTVTFRGTGGWWTPANIPALSPYLWYYIVATYDGVTEKIYVNGQTKPEWSHNASGSISAGTGQVAIGGSGNGQAGSLFNGTLDEVRVTARALSAAEILANYDLYVSTIPVIFVPGFAGTELYNGPEDFSHLVWLNFAHLSALDDLILNDSGVGSLVTPNKVMRKVLNNFSVYDAFVRYLTATEENETGITFLHDYHGDAATPYILGNVGNVNGTDFDEVINYVAGQNIWLFPVDFRVDMRASATRLDTLVNDVLEKTGATQVNLLAHSQGGVVIREYIRTTNPSTGRPQKVNRLITLGTPYLGLPWAFKGLRYGDDFGLGINPLEIKKIVQNWPSAYALLPDALYFHFYPLGYLYAERDLNGDGLWELEVNSLNAMDQLLMQNSLPDFAPVGAATTHYNRTLIPQGLQFQDDGRAGWSAPAAREIGRDLIVGTGSCATGQILETMGQSHPYADIVPTNGDGTVPLYSADWGYGQPGDASDTAQVHFVSKSGLFRIEHKDLPDAFASDVGALLIGNPNQPADFLAAAADATCTKFDVKNSVLSVSDAYGNQTGTSPDSPDGVENIPGSNYDSFENNQVVMVPTDGTSYSVSIHGTQTGTFDLRLQNWQNSSLLNSFLFKDVPQTPSTTASLTYSGSGNAPVLTVDVNGDGSNIVEVQPSNITYTISGNVGAAGVTLSYTDGTPKSATSDSSGNYSLNVSDSWSGTVTPALAGYTFTPANKNYFYMTEDRVGEDYVAVQLATPTPTITPTPTKTLTPTPTATMSPTPTYFPVTISGNAGIAGAILRYDENGPKFVTADGSGQYSFSVQYSWSGVVVPVKTGYTFAPVSTSYNNLQANQTNQDYTAAPVTFNIAANPGNTRRLSVSSSAAQGNSASYSAAISANGRYVAFQSFADNLVAGDTNGYDDIFLRDLQTNTLTMVSVDPNGQPGNRYSGDMPSVSADGRFVAFLSNAGLVSEDTNNMGDIFLRDMQTGTTTRVSVSSSGQQGNASAGERMAVSADGRYVAFLAYASNLVSGDTNNMGDIFLRDTLTGTTTRVSVDSSGVQANSEADGSVSISGDGRYVMFQSDASNLVSGDTNADWDIFLRDTQTNTTERVSVDSNGAQGDGGSGSGLGSISFDGRYVIFSSDSTNLVSGDTNGVGDVFLRDRQTGTTTRLSVDSGGTEANGLSFFPSISADGHYVVFESFATNLVAGDTNATVDIFLRDTQANTTVRISLDSAGVEGNDYSDRPALSANGRYAVFSSYATNLVGGDTDGDWDVFLHENGLTISGNASAAGVTLSYTDGMPKTATSGPDGSYKLTVSYGWSGIVTPSLEGYIFVPINRTYADLAADQTNQDYEAVAIATNTPTPTKTAVRTITPTPTRTRTPTTTATKTPVTLRLTSAGAQDGWILETSETSNLGGALNATAATFNLGDDAAKKQYRGILSFDTGAALPDNVVITSVILKVQKQGIVGSGDPLAIFQGFMVDIKNGFFGTATLQAGDFQGAASKSYGPFKPVPLSNWYTIDLTAAKDYVNKLATNSGLTQIRLLFKLDDNNNAVANYLSLYSGNAPAANRPQLVITYYVP
jgi:pimeloyl-ACP methyl ester carboxylesterase